MNIIKLKEILQETTVVLSKGEPTFRHLEAMGVPRALWKTLPYDHDLPGLGTRLDWHVTDCQFLSIATLLNSAPRRLQAFTKLLEEDALKSVLSDGPSYKHLVPLLGDDISALQFCGLGEAYGLWSVLLPKDLGVPGDYYDTAAALGWLCITGYPESVLLASTAVG